MFLDQKINRITYKNSVNKLSCGWIFKEVFPLWFKSKQVSWNPSIGHLRKRVVHQPSIQACNKGTCGEWFRNKKLVNLRRQQPRFQALTPLLKEAKERESLGSRLNRELCQTSEDGICI